MRRTKLALLLLPLLALTASAADFRYILSRDGHSVVSGNVNIHHVGRLVEQWEPPYLWASRKGKDYLIRDAATLARAHAAFSDSHALHAEAERLRKRMRPVEDLESDLEHEIDDLEDDLSDRDDLSAAERRRMQTKVEELERRLAPVRRQLRELEAEEERLDQREEAVTALAEKKLRDLVDQAITSGVARPAN